MAPFGTCSVGGTISGFVNINEVSTVVTAYALAGFASTAIKIGSSNTALAATGLQNAFAAIPNLMNVAGGYAYTTTAGGNGVVPQSQINTLANILASCVNSSGPTSSMCTTLFANATSTGNTGGKPTDTATAAINIAHHPGASHNINLFNLQAPTPPFVPNLIFPPNDYTLQIYYTASGLYESTQVAVDGTGNIWVVGQYFSALNELSPLGVALSPDFGFSGGGLNNPSGVAIDTLGNVWVANLGGHNVSQFDSYGDPLAGSTGFTGNGDLAPYQLAIDNAENVWITNRDLGTISELNSSGTEILNTTVGGSLTSPAGIGLDDFGEVWISDQGADLGVILGTSTGNLIGNFTCDFNCQFLAVTGGTPSVYLSDGNSDISHGLNNQGIASDITGGGLNVSTSLILDGASDVWVTNGNGTISEFNNNSGAAMSPSTGYTTSLGATYGIAVDGSGNVWVTDNASYAFPPQIAEILGAATPATTPLAQAVVEGKVATKP